MVRGEGGIQHTRKKWTQLDPSFWKNEGPKRSKTIEKGGQLYQKSRRKLMQNAYKPQGASHMVVDDNYYEPIKLGLRY